MPRKRRKRRRAWGSITEVDPGRRYVLRWVENTPQGRKRRSRTFRGTYREADLELSRLQVERADNGDKPVPTVGKAHSMWFEPWMERRVADGKAKAGTKRLYDSVWKTVASPRWSNVPVDSIQPIDVQAWLLGLTSGNAQIAITVLRKTLDFAVQYELAPSNKFRLSYEMPSKAAFRKSSDVYSLAEADAVFEKLHGAVCEAPFILSCFGSARTGESLGVRCREISRMEANGIVLAAVPVVRRMPPAGCRPLPDGDLKSPQSMRTMLIPDPYASRLFEISAALDAAGVEWLADRGDGLPLNMGALKRAWGREMGKDAIPFGNLRNSWRTFSKYEWGVDYDTLELLMGHSLQGVTGRHYMRPSVEQLADALTSALAKSRGI